MSNVEHVINRSIWNCPMGYVHKTYDLSKLRVLDQIFNVIGNGIRDIDEFNEYVENDKDDVVTIPDWFFDGTPIYNFFPQTDIEMNGKKFKVIDDSRELLFFIPEHETPTDGEYSKTEFKKPDTFVPYPNFDKGFSIVWRVDITQISDEWKHAAILFYKHCKDFFNSDKSNLYHYAVNDDNIDKRVSEIEKFFPQYTKDATTDQEKNNAITKAYGIEYSGDTKDFLIRRWEKEKSRILDFIDETVAMLEENIK